MIRRHVYMAEEGDASGSGGGEGEGTKPEGTVLGEEGKKESSGGDAGDDGKSGDESAKAKAGDDNKDEGAKGEGEGSADEGGKPGEFDTSKFEVPEGTIVNEAWLGKLVANEAIQKLSQSEVQGLIGMLGEYVADGENQRNEAHDAQKEKWVKEYESDPYVTERGKDKVSASALLAHKTFFVGLDQLLGETGLGSHPIMLIGMAKIAEALHIGEGKLEGGGIAPGTGPKGSAASRIFPRYTKGGEYASDQPS